MTSRSILKGTGAALAVPTLVQAAGPNDSAIWFMYWRMVQCVDDCNDLAEANQAAKSDQAYERGFALYEQILGTDPDTVLGVVGKIHAHRYQFLGDICIEEQCQKFLPDLERLAGVRS